MREEKYRLPKENELSELGKALQLIKGIAEANPEIDQKIWNSLFLNYVANCFEQSGASYEMFCEELDRVKMFYKRFWMKASHEQRDIQSQADSVS